MFTAWRGPGKAHTNIAFDWFSDIIPSFLCGFRGWAMDATPGHSSSHCCPVGEYSKVSVRWALARPLKATSNPGLFTGWLVLTTLPLVIQLSFFQGALDASYESEAWPSTAFPPHWPAPWCSSDKLFRTPLVYGQCSFFLYLTLLLVQPLQLSWISTEKRP